MKQIIIICILSAFTIIGFYVNREYWFGWIKPYVPQPQKEIPIGEAYGDGTLNSITSGQQNMAWGYQSSSPMIVVPADSFGYSSGRPNIVIGKTLQSEIMIQPGIGTSVEYTRDNYTFIGTPDEAIKLGYGPGDTAPTPLFTVSLTRQSKLVTGNNHFPRKRHTIVPRDSILVYTNKGVFVIDSIYNRYYDENKRR